MGQHWYSQDGSPLYTVIGANGKERDTTLRDARKLNLVPSVTTVMAGAAKPGLDNYLQTQLVDACWEYGCTGDFDERSDYQKYRNAVVKKSREHSSNAASKGTVIHDALEQYFLGKTYDKKLEPIILPVLELLKSTFGDIDWKPEVSFSHRLGFGGKVDMSYISNNFLDGDEHKVYHNNIILDFKTKDTDDIKKMVPYDEHGMQTAAYAIGLDIPNARRYNLFISTQVPGLMSLTESTDFDRDWGMFEALLKLWQLKNKYVPGV